MDSPRTKRARTLQQAHATPHDTTYAASVRTPLPKAIAGSDLHVLYADECVASLPSDAVEQYLNDNLQLQHQGPQRLRFRYARCAFSNPDSTNSLCDPFPIPG